MGQIELAVDIKKEKGQNMIPVKIVDSISNWFKVNKNSGKGINTRKRMALSIVVVYLFKNSLNLKV